ncbi:MAG: hypothetical protein ACI8TP_002660 [Acidimicrobiales bacterium]|jgi:hypothetical protein
MIGSGSGGWVDHLRWIDFWCGAGVLAGVGFVGSRAGFVRVRFAGVRFAGVRFVRVRFGDFGCFCLAGSNAVGVRRRIVCRRLVVVGLLTAGHRDVAGTVGWVFYRSGGEAG